MLLTHFDNDDFENILLLKMGHKPNPKNICRFHRHLFLLTHHKTLISSAVPDPRGLSCIPSLNTQSCIRRPLCSKLKFENLRSPKKRFKNQFLILVDITEFVLLIKIPLIYEVNSFNRKWQTHGRISKTFLLDHCSLSFLGQKC